MKTFRIKGWIAVLSAALVLSQAQAVFAAADNTEAEYAAQETVSEAVTAEAKASVTAGGNCGPNGKKTAKWSLESDGTLTISGTGSLGSYQSGTSSGGVVIEEQLPPWYEYRDSIKSLLVQEGITQITPIAFQDCAFLSSLSLPEGLTEIGASAFQGTALTSVTLPKSLTKLDASAFLDAPVAQILVNEPADSTTDPAFKVVKNVLFNNAGTKLVYMPSARTGSYTVPKSVKTIGVRAFAGSALSTVSFAKSKKLKTIQKYAFEKSAIQEADLTATKTATIAEGAFSNCHALKKAALGNLVTSLKHTFAWDENLTEVSVGTAVTEMEGTFRGCAKLASVTIPDGVSELGWCTFGGCESLSSVALPKGLVSIADQAFQGSGLTKLSLPSGLERIGNAAFLETGLQKVTIPASVKTIGIQAFPAGTKLTKKAAMTTMSDGSLRRTDLVMTFKIKAKAGQTAARNMLKLINSFRTGSDAWYYDSSNKVVKVTGLKKLKYDYALEKIAQQRAVEIAVNFSHARPDGSSCFSLTTVDDKGNVIISSAENIASGYTSYKKVMEGWKEDSYLYDGQGHRRNMLSSDYNAVGIGHVLYNGTHYWVQEFGWSKSSLAQTDPQDGTQTYTLFTVPESDQINAMTVSAPAVRLGIGMKVAVPKAKIMVRFAAGTYSGVTFQKALTWKKSNDTSVVQIQDKQLKGIGKGTTKIKGSVCGQTIKSKITVLATPNLPKLKKVSKGIQVSFSAVEGAVYYGVFRKVGTGKWKKLTVTKDLKYVDTSVKKGTAYTYTVRCIGKDKTTYESAYNKTGKTLKY